MEEDQTYHTSRDHVPGDLQTHALFKRLKIQFLQSRRQEAAGKKFSLFRILDSILLVKPGLHLPSHHSLAQLVDRYGKYFLN